MNSRNTHIRQPLAIVGIGCRFPGDGNTPASFWDVLRNGVDTFSDVPADRWSTAKYLDENRAVPGTAINFQGGFLSGSVYGFDADFFGISPREAARLDPQQRLLAEVSWEALEDAGIPADKLLGDPVGVYVGGFTTDNLLTQFSTHNRDHISPHTSTGVSLGMLANRVSYLFDFRGPSITIDTACSSSLVALNYACRDLWEGECSLALAAGVNLMLRPEFPIAMSKGSFLSEDSRSKAFDARANGYARGEGGGVVVLKHLSQAQADGDHVYAVIRGTGVNQDGRTSGITVPNPDAQEFLIRKVYRDFDIDPADVAYVEAHGTGTAVGDPIETSALGKALTQDARSPREILVGSVKANIGHLEAAAGIAATIKAALVLKNQAVPPQINFDTPNPNIPFKELGLRVPTKLEPLPKRSGMQSVSINSFGFGGANAHAVLATAPANLTPRKVAFPAQRPILMPVSAKSAGALQDLAKDYVSVVSANGKTGADLRETVSAMALRRAHLQHRLAIIAPDAKTATDRLTAFADGMPDEGVFIGRTPATEPRETVFLFTGMGPQWWGMGRELYQQFDAFRAAADAADAAFMRHSGWSILAEMQKDEAASRIAENQIAQPANFILQVGLAALWKDWGIQPSAVVGHSVGEVTAAYVSGALNLDEAALVSFHRSRCQQKMAGQGGMLAASISSDVAAELLTLFPGKLSIAAVNSPSSIAIAGDHDALAELSLLLEDEGIFNRMLKVEVAYHSYQMNGLEAELKDALNGLTPSAPSIPLWSTVTGNQVTTPFHDTDYWWQNVRQPVRLADAVRSLSQSGFNLFLEVGPHPVLAPAIKETIAASGGDADVLSSLRRGTDEGQTMTAGLAGLYCAGAEIDWAALYGDGCLHQHLPLYPWQRLEFNDETPMSRDDRLGTDSDVLLGRRGTEPSPTWHSVLTHTSADFLRDHVVDGAIVFPGAGYAQIMLAAQKDAESGAWGVVEDIAFRSALVFGEDDKPALRTEISEDGTRVAVKGRLTGTDAGWTTLADARLSRLHPRSLPASLDLAQIRQQSGDPLDVADLYAFLASRGLSYGPCFQGITALHQADDGILAEISAHPSIDIPADYPFIHPTMLDSAFQALITGLDTESEGFDPSAVFVPVAIKRLSMIAPVGRKVWCFGRVAKSSAKSFEGDITLCDEDGNVVARIEGFRCQAIPRAKSSAANPLENAFYAFEWQPTDPLAIAPAQEETWLLVSEPSELVSGIEATITKQGGTLLKVSPGPAFAQESAGCFTFDLDQPENWRKFQEKTAGFTFDQVLFVGSDGNAGAVGAENCTGLLQLVRHISEHPQSKGTGLVVITQGNGDPVAGDVDAGAPAQFALTGLARVIANEHPDMKCRLVDIGQAGNRASIEDLITEINSDPQSEDEVALRPDQRYVHRLLRRDPRDGDEQNAVVQSSLTPFTLDQTAAGEIGSMRFVETARVAPADDQVEMRILGVSLNFKDILKLTGVLSDDVVEGTFFEHAIGMEAAVEIISTGRNAIKFKPGERLVAALPKGCVRGFTTLPEKDIHGVPDLPGHDIMGLAGVPTAFVTAHYALNRIAALQPGEKVLLHSATGGVGLSAIQVAKHLGAEIYATAGSEKKREYLRSLGVQHVFNSRSLDFADDIRAASGGYGIDVVLNFLPGEAQDKSISLLAPFGRFIEIGKRDIEENRGLGLKPFNHNLQFTSIDIDRMLEQKPALFDALLEEVWEGVRQGYYKPAPITVFPISEFAEACHLLRRAEAIGKIVVRMEGEDLPIVPLVHEAPLCRADASYLVTGGFGGFGLKVAEWLADQGAGTLVLAGRSGPSSDEAKRTLNRLKTRGVEVQQALLDVSDTEAVSNLITDLAHSAHPLKGVYHAAGVLDDRLLSDMTPEQFRYVMGPKAVGAWNLHQASIASGLDLDHFVLFSSISALVGNPGQGNYAAANTFLDGLANLRASQGLAATSINWGALAQVGMAARDSKVEDRLNQIGVHSLAPQTAIEALELCLRKQVSQVGVMSVDWARWRQTNPVAANSAKFSELITGTDFGNDIKSALVAELLGMDAAGRQTHITTLISDTIAEVLRLPADRLDITQQLSDMGVDSLMMVDVQLAIEGALGIDVTVMELTRGGSVSRLALDLLSRLVDVGPTNGAEVPAAKAPAAPAANVDSMSDDEVERMLKDLSADSEVFAK